MGRQRCHVSENDRRLLSGWIRAGKTPQRVVRRARIVLLAADGCSARETARRLGVSTHTVSLWRRRYHAGGSAALLHDAPGRGRKATVVAAAATRMHGLLATPPPSGRWTVRAIASALGVSRASVHRVLKGRVQLFERHASSFQVVRNERFVGTGLADGGGHPLAR
jgi:transposase